MPKYGWKPEYQIPRRKKKVWGPPPDIGPRKFLKKGQLLKKKLPPQQRKPTEDELRILYEREIYRVFNLHASKEELQKQYEQFKNEKVYPGMVRAWLMNSYQGDTDASGMPQGPGSATMAGGVCYKGTFKQGLLHGPGLLQWGNGSSYGGDFHLNSLLGKGVYNWAGGAKYTGELFDGVPHGMGTMEGEEGLKYEGCWEYGKRQGQGKMTFGKIAVYEGNWKNDKKDGQGQMAFATGSLYLGSWLEGKRHGHGHTQVQRIRPGKERARKDVVHSHILALKGKPNSIYAHSYVGDWMGGLPHGSGRSEWLWDDKKKDNSVLMNSYIGSYENGMRHGKGSFFYASGALFKGHWRKNMKVGLGVLVYETGKMHFGVFSHDHYDPIANPGLDIKEPLESALQLATDLEDIETIKYAVWRAIMRHKNIIQDVFRSYSSIAKELVKPMVPAPPDESEELKKEKQGKKTVKTDKEEKQTKENQKDKIMKSDPKEKLSKKSKKEAKEKEGNNKKGKVKSKEPPQEELVEDQPKVQPIKGVEPDRPTSPRAIAGRSRGISNEQFWRLLHDGHMLHAGLGYGQVDRMLSVNDLSWDPFSDVHSHTRQLILREVVSAFVQIGLTKYQHENISSEEKVEKFLASHLQLLEFVDNDSLLAKVELLPVQTVFQNNRVELDRLFCELLLESETLDYTIKLRSLILFGQARRPQLDLPSGALLAKVATEVYCIDTMRNDEHSKLLDQDINYKEYEVIILLFATMGEQLPTLPESDELETKKRSKEIGQNLQKHPEDGVSNSRILADEVNKLNILKIPDNAKPVSQAKDKAKAQNEFKGKEKGDKALPKSPKSPQSPKSPKSSKENLPKAKGTTKEKNEKALPVLQEDAQEIKRKNKEAREKAKEEYESALASLLNKFIVEEVAVYKAPKFVKGIESKTPKQTATKASAKAGKKK